MSRSLTSLARCALIGLCLQAAIAAAAQEKSPVRPEPFDRPRTGYAQAGSKDERRDTDAGLVKIEQTEVALSPYGHVVLLKAQSKSIPIFVDAVVAQSIHGALTGEKLPRPLTHDLMRTVLEGYDGKVSRVVVSLKGATYYGELTVQMRGTTKVFDSRSSDAIALAIHFKAPILVNRELLDKAGQAMDPPAAPKPGERRL